ncbi:MAG: aminoacetone oxidase family FAD-binding enzyme, partial [Nitrospinota bacterium]
DDILLTKYGLSGSAILALSREFSLHFKKERRGSCLISLNFIPGKSKKEVSNFLNKRWGVRPDQTVEKSLFGLVPNKVSTALLNHLTLNPQTRVCELTENQIEKIASALTESKINITGTRGWNEAEFTAGGIDTEDVALGTLESRVQKNLFFAGEALDVDGEIGGYNLSWCWSSGWVAGRLLKGAS